MLRCRSHPKRRRPDSSDWAILAPDVPVFRTDDGTTLEKPWLLSFITCASPVASHIGLDRSSTLLHTRIHRVLAIARSLLEIHVITCHIVTCRIILDQGGPHAKHHAFVSG
ncbi:MAG: hypothetical protein EA427_02825 [Spirochaetaceae bacterium]|nr:MAG: hypothetical protein EA427_02825 [Spirochaetaceae bacterium]